MRFLSVTLSFTVYKNICQCKPWLHLEEVQNISMQAQNLDLLRVTWYLPRFTLFQGNDTSNGESRVRVFGQMGFSHWKKNVGWRLAINNATCVTLFWEITILLQKDLLPIDPTKSYKLGFELQKIFKSKQSVCQRYFLVDGFNPVVTNGMF